MTADPASVQAGVRLLPALTVASAGRLERGEHDGLRRLTAGAVERSST